MLRLMAMKVLLLVVLGVLALPACGDGASRAPAAALQSSRPADPVTRDFDLYTHCGVENALIAGRWWHVVDPLYGEDGPGTGPPSGWGDPYQPGRMTVDGDRAIFEGHDQRVLLTPAPNNGPVRFCR